MAGRFTKEQTNAFTKQYKENRKKGFKNYKNQSAGAYAGDATASRLHALTLDNPKQKKINKEFDNSDMYVGKGKSWWDETHKTETPATTYEVPELKTSSKNLRDQGFPGSYNNNQIDFSYLESINDPSLTHFKQADELDRYLAKTDSNYNPSIRSLDADLEARKEQRKRDKFWEDNFPGIPFLDYANSEKGKRERAAEKSELNKFYYDRFGMSMDQVLDQYQKYLEDNERADWEAHPIRNGLKDFGTAPIRSIAGGLGSAAEFGFPGSDLSQMLNSDWVQSEVQDVQRKRDYVYDSDKLSEGQKALLKAYYEGGDFLTNSALAALTGGAGAAYDAASGIGAIWQAAPWVRPAVEAALTFGTTAQNKQHELEKAGIDKQTANEMGVLSGTINAAASGVMANGNFLANEATTIPGQAAVAGAKAGLLGGSQQTAQEAAEALIMQDQGTFANDIKNGMAQGKSKAEAVWQASLNLATRIGGAGLTSAIAGAAFNLLGGGLGKIINNDPGTALAAPRGSYEDDLNNVYGDFQKTLGTANAGLIDEYTGYPGIPQLSDSGDIINLPDVSSGAPIQLPNTSSGPVIELPDNTVIPMPVKADGTTPNYANLSELGARLETTRQTIANRTAEIEAIEKQYKAIPDLKKNARENAKLRKQIYDLEYQNKQDAKLEAVLNKLASGKKVSTKDIVEVEYPELYRSIYDGRGGFIGRIGVAKKFAGDTPEAQQLAQELRNELYSILKGETSDISAFVEKAVALDNMARTVNADYVTYPKGKRPVTYTYNDVYGTDGLGFLDGLDEVVANMHKIYDVSKNLGNSAQAKTSPVTAPAVEAPAEAISAPVEIDPNNVIYHAGKLSRYNKADTAGRMEGMRGTGYYGTGYYFVDGPHKKEISKGSSYGDKPFTSVDISKYNNLFRVDTNAKADELHDFSKGLMRYVNGYNDDKFIDSDFGLDEEALAEYIDKIYSQYVDLFGDKAMSREDFFNRLNEMRNEYKYDFYDRSDSAITTFMKEHGYNGVDSRGTRSADTERGIVLYDLLEDSVLQSNVTDEAAKSGLMNTRIDNGNPVFDPELDAQLKEAYEGSLRAKEVHKEYLKLYDEKKLKALQNKESDLEEKIYNLENNVLPHERLMAERGDYYEEEMDRKYLETKRMFPEVTREEFDAMHEEDSELDAALYDNKTPVQFYEDRLKTHKKELAKVQKSLKAEEKKALAARDKAREIVNSKYNNDIAEDIPTLEDEADLAPIPEADIDAAVANEVANELPQLEAEDVINEDIIPEIESATANTRNYTPQEIAEINAFVAQRQAINAQVEEAAGHLMTTNPADLQNLFAQLDAINNEFYSKYPELFVNGKFAGMPKVDENVNLGYNNAIGGTANGEQVSGGNDGRGSNAVVGGLQEAESPDRGLDRNIPGRGGLLPDDRGAITEQLRGNEVVISPAESSELAYKGISNQPFYDANNNADVFTQALATAKANNPNGESVDGHDLNEIQSIIDNGGSVFLTEDATSGGAVEADGNLTCVFKDSTANKTPEMGTAIALAAIKKGAIKGDCFGKFLVNAYSLAGFEPVARVKYAYGISEGMDAYVDKMIAEGKLAGPPDVYAFKLRDGYDYDTAVAAHNDKTKAIVYKQKQLDELPLFEGDDSYDEMLAYRDSLLEKQSTQTASSNDTIPEVNNDSQGYFLRLLGDPEFLQEQAQITGYDPQTLVAYANQNLGLNEVPFVGAQPGGPTPPNDIPGVEPTPTGRQKTSEYYNSTMRNTATNKDMSDAEYGSHFNEADFGYQSSHEWESLQDADSLIQRLGGEDKATQILSDPNYFKDKEFNHVHVDAIQTLANLAEARAKELDAQGLNSAQAWRDANRLHKMVQRGGSNSAQVLQALQKWAEKSPRAQVDHLVAEINTAIDNKKTKGYTNMVNDLSDAIEDAILQGGSKDDIIAKVRQIFEENSKTSDYNTKKLAEKVVHYIRNSEKNPDLAEEIANIVKKKMGVSTMNYQQEVAIAELLEQAMQHDPNSRAYNVLVSRAMKMFDETLPVDSIPTKLRSVVYDNMLFSLRTMVSRNMGGNVVSNAIDFLEKPLMTGADVVTGAFTGNRTRSLNGKAIIEGVKGFGKGVGDWALDSFKDNVNTGRSGQKDLDTLLAQNHNTFRTNSNNKVVKGANIAFHVYDRLVKKGMELGDRPIYEMTYAAVKAELLDVVDRFGDAGLRKGLGLDNAKNIDVNDLIEYIATGEALESVLQNDSQLKKGAQALKKFFKESSEGILGIDVASLTMTPFVEVPANMADVMFQHTPVGMVSNIIKTAREKSKYGAINQRRFTKEAGRNVGGLAMAAGLFGAAGKFISGAYSKNKDEKKMQQNNGFQEYAIQTPDGSWQMDVSDIPKFGPMIQYSKRMRDAYDENGIKGMAEEALPALGAVTVDQLYQSLNRLTGSNYGYSSEKGNLLENAIDAVKSSAASIATPQLVRQTAQFLDPYKRDLGDYGTNEYNWNLFLNGLPGVRQAMLEPKVDTSGNYVPELGGATGVDRFMSSYVNPWKITHPFDNMSDVQKYAMELNLQSSGATNPQLPIFNKNDLVDTKGYDEANYSHAALRKADEEFYNANAELGDVLINQSWFRELPPEKQGAYLDQLFSANKENVKYNAVREGLTPEQIEAKGDELYKTDKLATLLREDNDAHTRMLMYFRDQAELDAINEKYGTEMNHTTYENKETKEAGSAEAWARDTAPAKELGYAVDDYQRYEANYPGGAAQHKKDTEDATAHGLTLDQYNKLKEKTGDDFNTALDVHNQLRRQGYDNYNVSVDYMRSDFPMDQFIDLYRNIDTNFNQAFAQKEVTDYLNAHPEIDDETAQRIWKIGGFKSQDGTKDTKLFKKNGKWRSGY